MPNRITKLTPYQLPNMISGPASALAGTIMLSCCSDFTVDRNYNIAGQGFVLCHVVCCCCTGERAAERATERALERGAERALERAGGVDIQPTVSNNITQQVAAEPHQHVQL